MNRILFLFGFLFSVTLFANEMIAEDLVQKMQSQIPELGPQSITKWLFNGKVFYEFKSTNCCDIPDVLFDENGEKFCILGGGYANKTDAKCASFYEKGAKSILGQLNIQKTKDAKN